MLNNINLKEIKNMAVTLAKRGAKVSLAKAASDAGITTPVNHIYVGLRWDTNKYSGGSDFDLDSSVFLCREDGKVRSENDFIFYNNLTASGVQHMGDERTGGTEGDDEKVNITLSELDPEITRIAFVVTIHDADARGQNFGQVENSGLRIMDADSGVEFINYELEEDSSTETAVVVGELYKRNGEWKFNAIGSGFSGGLKAICNNFGIDAE